MTEGQLKALQFARDVDALDYDTLSAWNYPHRERRPCRGGPLKVLIRSLAARAWIDASGRITDLGRAALAAREQSDMEQSLEESRFNP